MIYFIQAGEDGAIKIGYSTSVENRIAQLQTASPVPLKVLLIIDGDLQDEANLHRRFGDLRGKGEWFWPGKSIVEFVTLNKDSLCPLPSKTSNVSLLDISTMTTGKLFELDYEIDYDTLVNTPPPILENELAHIYVKHILERLDLDKKYGYNFVDYATFRIFEKPMSYYNDLRRLGKQQANEIKFLSRPHRKWWMQIEIERDKYEHNLNGHKKFRGVFDPRFFVTVNVVRLHIRDALIEHRDSLISLIPNGEQVEEYETTILIWWLERSKTDENL